MYKETFYMTNRMTVMLEMMIEGMDSLEEFEKKFPSEFVITKSYLFFFHPPTHS